MKKNLLILFFLCLFSNLLLAQMTLGIKAGVNLATYTSATSIN
jgi:hypothetical protein